MLQANASAFKSLRDASADCDMKLRLDHCESILTIKLTAWLALLKSPPRHDPDNCKTIVRCQFVNSMRSKCLWCLFHARKLRKMGLHTVSYPASRQDSPALERNFIGPHPPGDLSTSSYIWERFSRHGHDGQFRSKPFNSDILEHLQNSNTRVPLESSCVWDYCVVFSIFVYVFACLLASISWNHQARSHPCSCPQGSSIKHQQEHRSRAEALRLGILCQWQPSSIAQLPHSHESHRTSKSQRTRTKKSQRNASYQLLIGHKYHQVSNLLFKRSNPRWDKASWLCRVPTLNAPGPSTKYPLGLRSTYGSSCLHSELACPSFNVVRRI